MEPREFLERHPPFDRLGRAGLDQAERALEVVYAPRGEVILRREDPENRFLFLIRKGAVRLEREGRTVALLEVGEPFGFPSLLAGSSPHFDAVAEEDALLFRWPKAAFDALLEDRAFADFFLSGLAERLRRTASVEPPSLAGGLTSPVETLVTRPPVFVAATASVREAAQRMNAERVSSLLVRGEPAGILTDRDLRARVLAAGLDAATPVGEVASRPLVTAAADASVFEALLGMLERRIHHLPLERDGELVGVVTDTDLLRHHLKSPLYLLNRIDKIEGAAGFDGYVEEVAGMVETLYRGDLDAAQIGRIVSSLNDAATARLLRLAEAEMGPPPAPYAWIVFGSEGRCEQTLVTDQDNALVIGADTAAAEAYFAALAERVVEGLVTLGIPRCVGGFMATNWRRPLAEWERLFAGWIRTPEPQALIEAANFFDFRRVWGELDPAPLDAILAGAGREQRFLAHLARNALELRPPLGLFHRIREKAEGVDLKKGGIIPIVSLARLHALEAGSAARGTLERLADAAAAGRLSQEGAETLSEAFRFLLRLRLGEQLAAKRQGRTVDNFVRLDRLSAVERRHLKDTFVAIREIQETVALRYRTDLLG